MKYITEINNKTIVVNLNEVKECLTDEVKWERKILEEVFTKFIDEINEKIRYGFTLCHDLLDFYVYF